MKTNQELLAQAGLVLERAGVRKALTPEVPTTDSLATGEFMDRTQVERLVDLTVGQSGWLSAVTLRMRNQRAGQIPRMVISDVVTEGVDENAGATIATHPDTDKVDYACTKYQATWYLTYEDIREAAASGEPAFEAKVRAAFAKAMGNDMARAALRGDTALDASTRLNRLLRKNDGWLKLLRANAHRSTTTRGSTFTTDLFPALIASIPEEFRDDAALRWFMSSLLDLEWTTSIVDTAAAGSALGDTAKISRRRFTPFGIDQLLLPQMPTDLGFATLSGSAADADGVVDDGDGTLTATVDTLFGGYAAGNAGRQVKITCDATGQSETLTVANSGGHHILSSAGSLGQAVISAVPADYTLDLADCTPVILGNPINLFVVLCDQIRAYRKWEQEYERWRIDVYYEADFGVFNHDAMAMQDGVVAPRFAWGA